MQPTISSELIGLRPLAKGDFDQLFAVASDPKIWRQHPIKNRFERAKFEKFFDESLESGGALLVVDKRKGKVIGSSRFHNFYHQKSEVEIGWTFLACEYWGGLWNQRVKELMLSHAFRFVGQVIFLVDFDNLRSQYALEKIGARLSNDRYNDCGVLHRCYSISKVDYSLLGRPDKAIT